MESQEHIFMINSSVERTRGNRAINAAEDENYGEILKSGDNTLLKYKIFDGDGEILPMEGLPCEAVIKKEDKVVYRTPAEVDAENIVSFKITEALPSDRNNPYTIEFIITQGQDTLIFPSDDRINLYMYPSSLSVDSEIIEQTPEARLNETVIVAVNAASKAKYASLEQKDAELAAQLAHIDGKKINKNRGAVTSSDLSQEVKEQMTGGSVAVVGKNTILEDNIVDKQVTPSKTNFIQSEYITNDNVGYVSQALLHDFPSPYNVSISSVGRMLIFEIDHGVEYAFEKEESNRFKVGVSETLINPGNETVTSLDTGNSLTSFRFRNTTFNFLYVYVSNAGEEPEFRLYPGNRLKIDSFLSSKNIGMGKNLFDGNYAKGFFQSGRWNYSPSNEDYTAFLPIEPNTTYTISKNYSNRFNIALDNRVRNGYSSFDIDVSKQYLVSDLSELTITTGPEDKTLFIQVSSNSQPPSFMQVEKGECKTSWETYGYTLKPLAQPFGNNASNGPSNDGKVHVEDFRSDDLTDKEVIQAAFDSASGKIVVFESHRVYDVGDGVTANASTVYGIEGNGAVLVVSGEGNTALKYIGNKTSGTSRPSALNTQLLMTEAVGKISDLKTTSETPFTNTGFEIESTFKLTVSKCSAFGMNNGVVVKGLHRDITFQNNHFYHNSGCGIYFDNVNIHQMLIQGGHMYCNKLAGVKFIDGNLANIVFDGVSIENNSLADEYGSCHSLISFEETGNKNAIFEVIVINGCNLQDHYNNIKPQLNFDLENGSVHDLLINGNLIGNALEVPIYIKGVEGAVITSNNIVGHDITTFNKTITLEGINENIKISDNRLEAPLSYGNSTINKMLISDNLLTGFTLPDSDDGNIRIKDNF